MPIKRDPDWDRVCVCDSQFGDTDRVNRHTHTPLPPPALISSFNPPHLHLLHYIPGFLFFSLLSISSFRLSTRSLDPPRVQVLWLATSCTAPVSVSEGRSFYVTLRLQDLLALLGFVPDEPLTDTIFYQTWNPTLLRSDHLLFATHIYLFGAFSPTFLRVLRLFCWPERRNSNLSVSDLAYVLKTWTYYANVSRNVFCVVTKNKLNWNYKLWFLFFQFHPVTWTHQPETTIKYLQFDFDELCCPWQQIIVEQNVMHVGTVWAPRTEWK